jgi:hypothetical protein
MSRRLLSILLTVCFGLGVAQPAHSQGGGRAPVQLPEGPGRDLVENTCSRCHGLNMITASWGNTREGWRELFGSMVALPPTQADRVAAYLAEHFPVRPAPEAVLIPGPVSVEFTEWVLPRLPTPRPPRGLRRLDLVDRSVRKPLGSPRSLQR